jgi:phosphoketolase
MKTKTLSPELLHKMDAYWRTANYLSVGQIYLYDNPLLKRPLTLSDVKPGSQRHRPYEAAAANRAPAWVERHGFR